MGPGRVLFVFVLCLALGVVLFQLIEVQVHFGSSQQSGGRGLALRGASPARCPSSWRNVYFFHVPKCAGTTIRLALIKPAVGDLKWCNHWWPNPNDTFPYNCLGITGKEQRAALDFVRSTFGKKCNILSSHWDSTVLNYMDPALLEHTLLITSVRHPVDRFYRYIYFALYAPHP